MRRPEIICTSCKKYRAECKDDDQLDCVSYEEKKTMSEKITDEMMEILKHVETNNSGLFCGDSPDMQRLVELGLMESGEK